MFANHFVSDYFYNLGQYNTTGNKFVPKRGSNTNCPWLNCRQEKQKYFKDNYAMWFFGNLTLAKLLPFHWKIPAPPPPKKIINKELLFFNLI